MKKPSSLKSILIVIAVLVIVLIGYFYYQGLHPNTDSSSLLSQANPSSSLIGTQVLGLLSQIKSLHIDSTLFTDPGYQTLRDYSVVIPPENVGRPNPFAPLPGSPEPQKTGH